MIDGSKSALSYELESYNIRFRDPTCTRAIYIWLAHIKRAAVLQTAERILPLMAQRDSCLMLLETFF